MLKKIGFLTQLEFDLAIRVSRLSEKGRQASKKVLVDKCSQSAVAKEYGVSREKVRQYCHAAYRRHVETTDCPAGWITTTICLPEEELKKVFAREQELRKLYCMQRNSV